MSTTLSGATDSAAHRPVTAHLMAAHWPVLQQLKHTPDVIYGTSNASSDLWRRNLIISSRNLTFFSVIHGRLTDWTIKAAV
jgi:hypothetical protein